MRFVQLFEVKLNYIYVRETKPMKTYTKIAFIVLTGLLSLQSCTVQPRKAVPTSSILSSTEAQRFVGLDSFLTAANGKWATGSTALVMKNGKIVYHKAFGKKDVEANIDMQTSDIFRIASMTKPIVSAAALILVEQGKLSLDSPLSKYVPAFANMQVLKGFNSKDGTYTTEPSQTAITIRNLLTHTSGIGYSFTDKRMASIYGKNDIPDITTIRNTTIGATVDKLAGVPLGAQPGTNFYYGLSTDVLGRVIEIASGVSLDKFLRQNILKPLEMNDTYFFLPENKVKRLSTMYSWNEEKGLERMSKDKYPDLNFPFEGARTYFSGGGGLTSTAYDYSKFLQMILNKGSYKGKQVLSQETVNLMTTGQVEMDGSHKFGLGFMINSEADPDLGIKPGKLSWSGAFNTVFWIDPQRRSIAVLMTQVFPGDEERRLFTGFEKQVNKALDGMEFYSENTAKPLRK